MSRMYLIIALAFAVLATNACKRDADVAATPRATPAVAEPAATEPTTANAVISEVDQNSPASAAPGFDVKAFAGSYGGTLPCADCPGIDTTVTFNPEGTYSLAETWLDRNLSTNAEGTWTVRADGTTLLLDPTDKSGQDRWFQVVSRGELRALDTQGKPIASTLDYNLRRK